jgi:hypothetical protein
MYIDNLTIASLLVFTSAFGSFVYTCVIRIGIRASNRSAQDNRSSLAGTIKPGFNKPSGD